METPGLPSLMMERWLRRIANPASDGTKTERVQEMIKEKRKMKKISLTYPSLNPFPSATD